MYYNEILLSALKFNIKVIIHSLIQCVKDEILPIINPRGWGLTSNWGRDRSWSEWQNINSRG